MAPTKREMPVEGGTKGSGVQAHQGSGRCFVSQHLRHFGDRYAVGIPLARHRPTRNFFVNTAQPPSPPSMPRGWRC